MEPSNSESSVAAAMVALVKCTTDAPSNNLMRIYLDKLKDLVPHCPKNRDVSKLELIQHVIDYINDLQETLQSGADSETPPSSPPPNTLSFSEAFSHLNFGNLKRDLQSTEDAGVMSYSSDGSSDYDSRGSSPISHHSDVDYSSDEFSSSGVLHPLYAHNSSSLCTPSLQPPLTAATAVPTHMSSIPSSSDHYRHFYRKDYTGVPTYYNSS